MKFSTSALALVASASSVLASLPITGWDWPSVSWTAPAAAPTGTWTTGTWTTGTWTTGAPTEWGTAPTPVETPWESSSVEGGWSSSWTTAVSASYTVANATLSEAAPTTTPVQYTPGPNAAGIKSASWGAAFGFAAVIGAIVA
jgi:hypothetical protein